MSIKDNLQYLQMKVREGEYVPDVDMDYPQDDPYRRLLKSEHLRELVFDENYVYLDDSFKFKFNRFLAYLSGHSFLLLLQKLKYGLRFEGLSKMRRYHRQFKQGAVTVCNHCYHWDGVATVEAYCGHYMWIPMYADHFNGDQYWWLKHAGGIPVPTVTSGLRKFNEAFDEAHRRHNWIHVFPEECNWKFYKPIKPFRKGAFTMAYKYDIPVIVLNISYRERKGIHKLFGKWFGTSDCPLLTYRIGDPIYPDTSKPRKEEVDRLLREAHAQMCSLAGIVHNPWPAFWDETKGGNI